MRRIFLITTYLLGIVFFLSFAVFVLSVSPLRFAQLLRDPEVAFALKFSLLTATISTAVTLSVALPIAYSLARYDFPLKRFIKVIVDLPMAFPELLTGLVLLVFFSHLVDPLLGEWAPRLSFTPKAVVLAQTAVALPFAIKVLYTAFEGVDRRYEWVARSLGYKPWEVFFKVVLPMVRGGLFSALAVAFARAFGAFGAVLIFAGGVRMKTETLPVGVFLSLSYGEMDKAVVMGSLLMVASLVTLLIIELLGEGKKQPRR